MKDTLDAVGSTLASTLRLWYGTNARETPRHPEKPLELYEFEAARL